MSRLPKIAIVGRPNVGKSALFNRICNKRIAIVDEMEGVTRDRLYADGVLFGRGFQVIDTGGIDPRSTATFNEEVKQQAEIAIEEADSLIMVVDVRVGVTNLDVELARLLHRTNKPVCLAINKVDGGDPALFEFHCLGITQQIGVSATQGTNIAELLGMALADVKEEEIQIESDPSIKIAIVGRANVGKSSLVNTLLNDSRCIVSPIPGTTRDSIDNAFTFNDQLYTLIDTAGIRRKHAEHHVVDKFAAIRTRKAIERSDICLLMLDATQGMSVQDKKIATTIEKAGKGCIILLNKWDLVQGYRMEHCLRSLQEEIPFLKHCPKHFISATTGRNIDRIFPQIIEVQKASVERINTAKLNTFIERVLQRVHPPMINGKRLRIYYIAQVCTEPPRFVMFVNYADRMTDTYKKYIINRFRETFPFTGIPLIFHLKNRKQTKVVGT